MIRLASFLRPVHSAKSLYRWAGKIVFGVLASYQLRGISRGERDRCWCGGHLLLFRWHPSYGVCDNCGCYVNRRPPTDLQELYSSRFYWHLIQRCHGYAPIEARGDLYKSDGRLAYWLQLVSRYGPKRGRVVEVGCAPGVLLAELQAKGYECAGVEPDEETANWMRQNVGIPVQAGFFPGVELPKCDLFLAFDVIEHSPWPDQFVLEMARLLNPGGVAIVQTPVERYGYEPPFGEAFSSAFKEFEHLFLFTNKAMEELGRRSGLDIASLSERLWLHHEICVFRKPL